MAYAKHRIRLVQKRRKWLLKLKQKLQDNSGISLDSGEEDRAHDNGRISTTPVPALEDGCSDIGVDEIMNAPGSPSSPTVFERLYNAPVLTRVPAPSYRFENQIRAVKMPKQTSSLEQINERKKDRKQAIEKRVLLKVEKWTEREPQASKTVIVHRCENMGGAEGLTEEEDLNHRIRRTKIPNNTEEQFAVRNNTANLLRHDQTQRLLQQRDAERIRAYEEARLDSKEFDE